MPENAKYPLVPLSEVLVQDTEYITELEPRLYPKLSVKLYGKGVVLDEPADGATVQMKRHQFAKPGQIILSEIWAKKGAIGIVPQEGAGALITSHFFLFDIDESKLLRPFISWLLAADYFELVLGDKARGTTGYAAVRPKQFLPCTIPLPPPLDEQRRIVARIEELAALIEEARGLRVKARDEKESLITSSISSLPFDETNWGVLQDAALTHKGSVRSGPFGSQLHHDEFVDTGVVAIGTKDVQVNRFVLKSGWYVTPEKFEQFKRYQVFSGDILVTIIGASIGRFCVVPTDVPLAFTTKHIIAVTLDHSIAEPKFASYMLNFHLRCRESIFSQTEGSAQPSLNSKKVRAIALPIPPLDEQRRIVVYLDDLQAQVDELTALQDATQAELDALLPSLLDRAFRGEL